MWSVMLHDAIVDLWSLIVVQYYSAAVMLSYFKIHLTTATPNKHMHKGNVQL